ncbi:MAG: glutathione transferase GstA [Steroidobacteraceae bacterium]
MKLYYMPGACALACNIALREAGLRFELVKVDRKTRRAADGLDYNEVNSKGYVPALTLDNGEVLTENLAVLQYIADRNPAAKLAPAAGTIERYRLEEWLSFINSELHKAGYTPLFRQDAPEAAKDYARKTLTGRLDWLERSWGSRSFLLGEQFTVADAYLWVVLGWGTHVDMDVARWPQLKRFHERVAARPTVIEALKSEARAG